MCRTHAIRFACCGHQEPALTQSFPCLGDCKKETIIHDVQRFCSSCFLSDELPRVRLSNTVMNVYFSDQDETRRARQILNGNHHSFWTDPSSGVVHDYGSLDLHLFSDPIEYEDSVWLKNVEYHIHADLWFWLLDDFAPDPSRNYIFLYLQIRNALLAQQLRDAEEEIVNGPRVVPGLQSIMIPVENPKDPACPICLEEYTNEHSNKAQLSSWGSVKKWWNSGHAVASKGEDAVRLSDCSHEFGSKCLGVWGNVGDWAPGKPLSIACPACAVISELNPRTGYQTPWWMRMLRSKWAIRRAVLGQVEEEIDW